MAQAPMDNENETTSTRSTPPVVSTPLECKRSEVEELALALKSESKLTRKTALKRFHSYAFSEDCVEQLPKVFSLSYPHVVRSLADSSEACRVAAINIVESFLLKLDLTDYHLEYIIPALVRRVGCPEIVEEAEELRLLLVKIVYLVIEKFESRPRLLERYLNDFTNILCKTAMDPFPDVRVETGACIVLLASSLKRDFHQQSESYIKPLLPSLSHQRFRVRVSAVDSLCAVVLHGSAKCLEVCVTPLAEKLFDEVDAVRLQVVRSVGSWLLQHNDRYSYWHRMIPLMLTGLSDASEDIRSEAQALWLRVGEQYVQENEQELKNHTDFLERDHQHRTLFPAEGRPHLGCRVLVQRNIGKIVPAIVRECEGWQADARLRSIQLLNWLVLCAEEDGTQHAPVVLTCLCRAARDDDQRVVRAGNLASQRFGFFIHPETWWPLLKPELHSWAAISVLADIVSGSKDNQIEVEIMKGICVELATPELCQTKKYPQQMALITFAKYVVMNYSNCAAVKNELFTIIFTVQSMSDEEVLIQANFAKEYLSKSVYCSDSMRMNQTQLHRTLAAIKSDPISWTTVSPDFRILYNVITSFGGALCYGLDDLAELLVASVGRPQLDPTVRVKLFTALSKLLLAKHANFHLAQPPQLTRLVDVLLRDVIIPNLVWAPGLTAESVRCAAASCLVALLQEEPDFQEENHCPCSQSAFHLEPQILKFKIVPEEHTLRLLDDQVVPLLLALLDDRNSVTRCRAINAAASAASLLRRAYVFPVDTLHKLYSVVLKRLDDGCEEVRALAVTCLVQLFRQRPADYDRVTFGAHIDAVYSTLLVHLDDTEDHVHKRILEATLELSVLDPELLLRKVKANVHLYRNKAAFESLDTELTRRLALPAEAAAV